MMAYKNYINVNSLYEWYFSKQFANIILIWHVLLSLCIRHPLFIDVLKLIIINNNSLMLTCYRLFSRSGIILLVRYYKLHILQQQSKHLILFWLNYHKDQDCGCLKSWFELNYIPKVTALHRKCRAFYTHKA